MRVLHLSRRRLLPALLLVPAALAAVLFFVLRTSSHRPNSVPVPDGAGCAAYLEGLGWEVAPDPIETLQLRLPEDLKASCADYVACKRPRGCPLPTTAGRPYAAIPSA